ncbi:MAG: hypothetical protein V8S24_14350 [Gordonibacter pamelaeae]
MEDYVFEDVLAGSTVTCGFPGLDTRVAAADGPRRARTLFFPGCSLINYALPLVKAVYDLLAQAGTRRGHLAFVLREDLELRAGRRRRARGVRGRAARSRGRGGGGAHRGRLPELRRRAARRPCRDERTAGVEVVPLPLVLEALGYRVDAEVAKRLLAAELEAGAAFYEVCAEGARPPLRLRARFLPRPRHRASSPTACARSCPPSWWWSRRMRAGAPSAAARSCGRRGMRTRRSSSRRRAGPRPWRPAAPPSWRRA